MTKLQQLFKDLDTLYTWTDDVYKVSCKKDCNRCCEQDIIWLLLPELIRYNTITTPKDYNYGCPFRTKTGCSVYPYRSLICRTYGANYEQIKGILPLTVEVPEGLRGVAGAGECIVGDRESSCNVEEVNNIMRCYQALAAEWGLVAIGRCEDSKLQITQETVLTQIYTTRYTVYAPNGVPAVYEENLRKTLGL